VGSVKDRNLIRKNLILVNATMSEIMSAPTQVGGYGGWGDTETGAALSLGESGPDFIRRTK